MMGSDDYSNQLEKEHCRNETTSLADRESPQGRIAQGSHPFSLTLAIKSKGYVDPRGIRPLLVHRYRPLVPLISWSEQVQRFLRWYTSSQPHEKAILTYA